jgi:ABC-type nitrate/sulfonate/bicarbonate transport system substrate-binding protein
MKVRFAVFLLMLAWITMLLGPGLSGAAEKVKIGTALSTHAVFVMPMLAAAEKGFWKQQGLDAEWLPFRGGAAMAQAAAGKAIHMGKEDRCHPAGRHILFLRHRGGQDSRFRQRC